MTFALAGFAALVFVVSVVLREREAIRHAEEIKAERTEIALLNVAHREQMVKAFDAYRIDVQKLCQRIQAPELAVMEHQQHTVKEPDSMPLSDEELARRQEAAELIAHMERIENEGLVA